MRAPAPLAPLALLALLASSAPAFADNFVEIAGGVMIPAGDDQWTDYVESGPKLGVRVGGYGEQLGAVISADWTPVNTDNSGFSFPGFSVDTSAHRFRLLGSLGIKKNLAAKMMGTLRFGGGLDIARVSVDTTVGGNTTTAADTDLGLALEPAAGLWFNIGSIQVGGEVALPISWHDDDDSGDVDLEDYMAVDVDLMFGVRFLSK
jgi:hypothetical protein